MTVTKEITRLDQSNVKLTITVPKDDVKSEYDEMLSEYLKDLQIPGFRKGKVPRDVLIRKFGDSLKEEASTRIIEKSVQDILKDESLAREDRPLPYCKPEIQGDPKVDFDNDMQFSMVYDVLPKVIVGKWEGLEVEIPDTVVSEEDIVRELEDVQERNSIIADKEEGAAAASGDVVTVNYCELSDSGQVIENSKRQDFVFTLGSGYNFYHFDDEVTGMKKDETKEFSKTYPEDSEDKELAGKTKKLQVTLTALKIKNLPELNDDLAQDVDEKFKTLEDLKTDIRTRLNSSLERRIEEIKNNKLLEMVMETTPVIIPKSMIDIELDSRWRNLARRFNTDADGLYKIMEQNGQNIQAVLDEWRPAATKALHSRLIVETLMEDLKLEASDEEVEKEIDKLASTAEDSADQVREYYRSEESRQYLKEDIREEKLFKILWEKNTVKAGNKTNYVDLMAINS